MTDPKDPPGLKYVLDCLKRSADNSECWPVYPAEAGAILATIERLRKENEELRGERAAVVAWLLERGHYTAEAYAGSIERGEHRREEEP
jgi:hypothetical protein